MSIVSLGARFRAALKEERPLQMADLEWLVDCARLTPCARNAQQLRYSLVGPGETCQRPSSPLRRIGRTAVSPSSSGASLSPCGSGSPMWTIWGPAGST